MVCTYHVLTQTLTLFDAKIPTLSTFRLEAQRIICCTKDTNNKKQTNNDTDAAC